MTWITIAATVLLSQSPSGTTNPPETPDPTPVVENDSRKVGDTKVTYLFGSILPKEAQWEPLTDRQRWQIYWKNTWANPGAFFRAAGTAGLDQNRDEPREWGQGMKGYGRRFADRYATFAIQDTITTATAAALDYDVRYLRCQCTGFFPRTGYAIAQSFVTKNRDGRWRPNIPQWVGGMGGAAIATYGWRPASMRNANEVWRAGISQIAFPMFFNTLIEFGPEIKRAFSFGRK